MSRVLMLAVVGTEGVGGALRYGESRVVACLSLGPCKPSQVEATGGRHCTTVVSNVWFCCGRASTKTQSIVWK